MLSRLNRKYVLVCIAVMQLSIQIHAHMHSFSPHPLTAAPLLASWQSPRDPPSFAAP